VLGTGMVLFRALTRNRTSLLRGGATRHGDLDPSLEVRADRPDNVGSVGSAQRLPAGAHPAKEPKRADDQAS